MLSSLIPLEGDVALIRRHELRHLEDGLLRAGRRAVEGHPL